MKEEICDNGNRLTHRGTLLVLETVDQRLQLKTNINTLKLVGFMQVNGQKWNYELPYIPFVSGIVSD